MTDDKQTPASETPTGISRRKAIAGVALGAGAVWAAPAITTLGGSAFAATGSPAPVRRTLVVNYFAGQNYVHQYTITVAPDGSFTGPGQSITDPHPETISGTLTATSLVFHAIYTDTHDYYDVTATVTGSTFSGNGTVDGGSSPGTVTGTIS